MKTKIKKILKVFRPLLLSAVIVASSIAIPINEAHAATIPNGIGSAEISKIHKDLGDEAWAQLTWHILKKCVKGSYEERDTDFVPSEILTDDDFFDYARGLKGVVTMPTGYYLENKVQGNGGDDGAIYCRQGNNKILTIAADAAGIDYRQILCDNNNPGIMYDREKPSRGCNPSSTKDAYQFHSGWNSHLEKVWNQVKSAKGWATSWGDIGNYGGVNGYALYGYEAGYRCGSSAGTFQTESEKPSGYYINPALKNVGQDAGKSYEYFTADNDIEYEFVNRSDISNCSDLITRANSDTIITAFVEKVLVTFNDRCKNFYQNEIDTKGDKIADEAKDQFNGLKNADQGTYPFLEDKDDPKDPTDTEDKQCVTIEGILHPEQTDDDSFADDAAADNETNEPNCYTKAGSLGWILCPLIDSLGTFILEKYEQWIVPALQMDVSLFSDSSDNGTFQAWQIFRDIANVLFVILFLFVIFSQLTGVGIDNYGIKKILPKLIVGAILINLSYIICQLSIDVFNIMGRGIGSLFKGISDQLGTISSLQVDNVTAPSSAWESFLSSGWNTVLIVIVGALGVAAVLSQGLAIIIPVLLLFISIAFSIFTLIAILGIRQAAAVLLVAVSPLAFACYMLPNTKPIFDKWFNFFKGLLMAFPVCSALIYGGDMAGKILLTAAGQNTWVIISAAVVSVAPIFFIPKVITGSLGAISGAVARFGGGLGHGAKRFAGGRLSNSFLGDRARYNQQMRQQKTMARIGDYNATRGRKLVDKYNKKGLSPSNMNSRQRRAYNSAMGAVNARNQEMENAYASDFAAKSDDDIQRELVDAAKSGKLDENMLTAGLGSINDNDQLTQTLNALNGTEAGKKMLESATAQQRLAGVFRGKDDVINQSIGKLMAQGKTYEQMKADGSLAAKVQGAGVDAMKGINKDAFKIEGAADLFSDEQLRAAAAAGYTGKTAEEFSKMMEGVSSDRKENIVSGMTAEQVASLSQSSLDSLGGAETVKAKAEDAINTLNSADGQNLRTKMDGNVMNQLGIKSGNGGDAASGGSGPAPSGNNGGGTGGGAPSSGGSNPPAKPVVAKVEGKAGTVNIREGDRPGEYKTDSGIILGGGTVDNIRHNNNGGNNGGSSDGGIIIAH